MTRTKTILTTALLIVIVVASGFVLASSDNNALVEETTIVLRTNPEDVVVRVLVVDGALILPGRTVPEGHTIEAKLNEEGIVTHEWTNMSQAISEDIAFIQTFGPASPFYFTINVTGRAALDLLNGLVTDYVSPPNADDMPFDDGATPPLPLRVEDERSPSSGPAASSPITNTEINPETGLPVPVPPPSSGPPVANDGPGA